MSASGVAGFVQQINDLLKTPLDAEKMGQMARQRVIESYGWTAHLSGIDPYLLPSSSEGLAV
jgi:hypothetical protein